MKSPLHADVVLSTRGLGKQYANDHWGLRDSSLELTSGKMVAVLGPNGAGKSTLIHMLAGAIQPSEGTISIVDSDLRVGWSSQRTSIDWYLNTRQNIELGGRLFGLGKKDCRQRAQELMDRFHLAELADRDVSMLSGGQQQRIQVARTLMSQPEIMLLDEPTAALDVESSEHVLGYIREQTQHGALALVSSHDLGLLEQFCDEVLFILDGKVITHRPMPDFLRQFTPSDRLTLILDTAVSADVLASLSPFSPEADPQRPTHITVSMQGGHGLAGVISTLSGTAQVMEATRTAASLRDVYLRMTKTGVTS